MMLLKYQTENKCWRENLVSRVARAVVGDENNAQAFSFGVEGGNGSKHQTFFCYYVICGVLTSKQSKYTDIAFI